MKHTDAAIYKPFNSHYPYFGSDPESKAFLWQTSMHFICTQMFVHTGDSALTLPRVNQASVQQGEILANILSAYNKEHW